MDISVVVPIYNEEENIEPLFEELFPVMQVLGRSFEILFVDDGSTDGSPEILRALADAHAEVRHLRFRKNCGQTAAFWAGIEHARGEVIITMDGDGQNDPADIPAMLDMLAQVDMVCGWRKKRKDTPWRRFQSRFANKFRDMFLHDGIRDTGCSLKVFRKPAPGMLPPFTGLHRFIPALLMQQGYRIAQTPVNHRPRTRGVTKYSLKNRALNSLYDLIAVCWMGKRRFHYELETPNE